ncbi:membrane protein [Rhodococcus aerolatus]
MPTTTRTAGATRAPDRDGALAPGPGTDEPTTPAAAPTAPAAGPAEAPVADAPRTRRRLRPARWALAAAALYLAVRGVGVLVLAWMAGRNGTDLSAALTKWDGQWFLGLAGGGYDGVPARLTDAYGLRDSTTALAFFPGYPALVAAVAAVPGVGLFAAAIGLNVVLGVVAALGVARLGALATGSPRAGTLLVLLYAAAPMGVALSMAYSETLFCALAAWALVGVLERRWLLAGVATLLAGLVRPTAAALLVAVGLALLVALVRSHGWRPRLRVLLAGALAPLGLLAYLGWVGARTGSWDGWFSLQRRGWASGFDGGRATWGYTLDVLSHGRTVLEVVSVLLLAASLVLLVVSVRTRVPWPVWVYGAGVVVMVVTSNGLMTSKARLLLPAFVLLAPAARVLARQSGPVRWWVGTGIALASAWFGAYTLAVYPFAI